MRLRKLWLGCAGLVALFAPVGCTTTRRAPQQEGLVPALPASTAQAAARDLPASEAGPLCLVTADSLYKAGDDLQAMALYEKARASGSRDPRISRRLAVLYGRAGDMVKSRDEFQKAMAARPRDADLCNDMGYLAYSRGQMPEAEASLRQALRLDPSHKRAAVNLGLALAQQSKYMEAMEAFQHAVPEAQAHANLAFVYSTQGKREDAAKSYRLALRIDPDMPVARDALAKLEGTPRPSVPARRPEPREEIRLTSHEEPSLPAPPRRSPAPQAEEAPRELPLIPSTPLPILKPAPALPEPAKVAEMPHIERFGKEKTLEGPKSEPLPQMPLPPAKAVEAPKPLPPLGPTIEVIRGEELGGGFSPVMERGGAKPLPPRPLPLSANERKNAPAMPSPVGGW